MGETLRYLQATDLQAGMRLKELAGWNQTEEDWRLFLDLRPEGCFAAVRNGRVVGTVTTLDYEGLLAWIGMLLVDPQFRRLGIGTCLMQRALESLSGRGTIKLDATPAGMALYERLGFRGEYGLQRMVHECLPALDNVLPAHVVPIEAGTSPEVPASIVALDRAALGANRAPLLRALYNRLPEAAWQIEGEGFCLSRRGSRLVQIGPVVAGCAGQAIALCRSAMRNLVGCAVVLDVPERQETFLEWLRGLGFAQQRPFTRLYWQENYVPGAPERQFATAGAEFG